MSKTHLFDDDCFHFVTQMSLVDGGPDFACLFLSIASDEPAPPPCQHFTSLRISEGLCEDMVEFIGKMSSRYWAFEFHGLNISFA